MREGEGPVRVGGCTVCGEVQYIIVMAIFHKGGIICS